MKRKREKDEEARGYEPYSGVSGLTPAGMILDIPR